MAENKVYYEFLKYNNYFNRKIMGYSTAAEYETAVGDGNFSVEDKLHNFNPNDYITTEIIVNDIDPEFDYLLILDEDEAIVSRWFILENVRTRSGQYKLSLRRDVVYDNIDTLLEAPVFVQKGYLPDDDPFIFNDEGMSFNEIKTQETFITEYLPNVAWLVGYMSKSTPATSITVQTGSVDNYISTSDIASELDIDEADLVGFLVNGSNQLVSGTPKIYAYINYSDNTNLEYRGQFNLSNDFSSIISTSSAWAGRIISDSATRNLMFAKATGGAFGTPSVMATEFASNGVLDDLVDNWSTINNGNIFLSETSLAYLRNIANNKIPVLYNSVYYYLSISAGTASEQVLYVDRSTIASINTSFENYISAYSTYLTDLSSGGIKIVYQGRTITFTMTEITQSSGVIPAYSTSIVSTRQTTNDATFDMFAIPIKISEFSTYHNIHLYSDAGSTSLDSFGYGELPSFEDTLKIATQIAVSLDANLYDLQLLPYCPLRDKIVWDYGNPNYRIGCYMKFYNMTEGTDFTYIVQNSSNVSFILWCNKSSFSISRETAPTYFPSLSIPSSSDYSVKVMNLVDKYRLCSPNYQGAFDFSLQKNGGSIPAFDIYCTYKPYTPYIKVAPSFSYMYGTDFGDMRGLICGGDFSISRVNSAWESYELNNKNYQNIFNRDIQNLDFNYSIQMRNQLVSGGVGILGDAAKGAAAGSLAFGPIGAGVGSLVGTAGSIAGYAIDINTLTRQQQEERSLAIDKFNYQLGNIKALPYTLTKVSNFNVNSKIFPFLEYYTATTEEKDALTAKIEYESMTVMRIDTMQNYYGLYDDLKYFKGVLIRNNDLFTSTKMFDAIYEELLKGVYI